MELLRDVLETMFEQQLDEWSPPVGEMEKRFVSYLTQMNPGWLLKLDTQVSVGPYYIDVAIWVRTFNGCGKIAVEIDGLEHRENWHKDMTRSVYLNENGWKVLRFWNWDVRRDARMCVAEVANVVVGWCKYELEGWDNPFLCKEEHA